LTQGYGKLSKNDIERFKKIFLKIKHMEIQVLEKEKNKIKFKVIGEDDTFCNILKKELWNDSDTEIAAYRIEHSIIDHPIFIFHSKKDVIKALNEAIDRIKKKNKEFLDAFKDAIK